jgi:hypothetical protein
MTEPIARVAGVDMEILHDVKNLVGIVHAAAIDLDRAHQSGEELSELIEELVSLTSLVSDALRGLAGEGRKVRPFDLRAAVFCARIWQPNLALGALMRPTPIDAEAGALTDFVLALAIALGADAAALAIQQDGDDGLLFQPTVLLASELERVVAELSVRATQLELALSVEDAGVRVRPRSA